jgi:signal transduction histidine kinase
MGEFIRKLFSQDFMPHGYCYLWQPGIVWLHATSDSLIALSYYLIPLVLIYFVRKRTDLPFNWIFVMFGIFILACGTTHIMEVWTLWHGVYRLSGVIKAFTAVVSATTAVMLVKLIPQALALPSPTQLRTVNLKLENEITERLRIEEALQHEGVRLERALESALDASRLKSAFLANTSHEIRAPLQVVIGSIELIGDHLAEQNDESQKDHTEGAERACVRLLRTIDNILDISKIEAGAFNLVPTQLEIGPWLERLLADFRFIAERKGIALTCTIDEPNARVVFDEYCLTQALTNLLDNAIKFTEKGEVVCRLYRAADRRLCLDIRDSGIGISEEYLPHLFEPFSQEQSGSTRRFQGTGLGLSLTRQYLGLNGAEASVESEKGKGTTFTIHFSRESEGANH